MLFLVVARHERRPEAASFAAPTSAMAGSAAHPRPEHSAQTGQLLPRRGALHAVRSVLSAVALLLFVYLVIFMKSPVNSEPQMVEPRFPDSYLAAATDFTEMVSPLAVPVTLACSQASLFSSSTDA
jgi:hypothetical protein